MTGRGQSPRTFSSFVAFFLQFIAVTPHFGTSILTLHGMDLSLDLLVLSLYVPGEALDAGPAQQAYRVDFIFVFAPQFHCSGFCATGVKVTDAGDQG